MALGLVARSAVAIADHLNAMYRVFKGTDADSLAVRLPTAGSFEVRHSVTNAPVLRVTDAGLTAAVDGSQITDATITSAKIKDNEIVDADVKAAAGIAVSKLAHVGANSVLRSNGTANVGGPIVTNDMVANTIDADRLLNASITASKLGTGITAPAMAVLQSVGPLGAPSATLNFPTIPGTYRQLELRLFGRTTAAGASVPVKLQINGDAGALYQAINVQSAGSATTTTEQAFGSIDMIVGVVPAVTTGASLVGVYEMSIPNYTDATAATGVISSGGYSVAGINGSLARYESFGYYYGTGAVTQIVLYPMGGSWAVGTFAVLYGLL